MHQHKKRDADNKISVVATDNQTQQYSFLHETSFLQQDNNNLQRSWAEDTFTIKHFHETLHSIDQLVHHTVHNLLEFHSLDIIFFIFINSNGCSYSILKSVLTS
jgi:hypothetical protein